ncbi:beta strand repeat-containing protein, partial [Streptomyces sp. NPDC001056]
MISTVTRVTSSVSLSDEVRTVVLTARVVPDAPHGTTPTGTVTFVVGADGEPLTGSLDDDGTATVTTGAPGSGTHEITATYHGDAAFAGSTDVHTLAQIPTSMTITSVPNPSAPGQPVTITATVTPETPGPGVPTGSVVFTLTGIGNFTVALDSSGQAVLTTSAFTAGEYTITGSYTGDATYLPISQSVPHLVSGAADTTTTVTSAPNPSAPGQSVTFTAHVAPVPPATGTPTGTVTFTVDGTGGGTFTATLSGGTATISLSTLGVGPHNVTAVYHGDAFFNGSTGTEVHTVGQASTTTTVTTSPNPSVHGQPVTVTATVVPVPPGAGVPTGSVLFTYDGGSRTVTLDAHGTASFTLTTPLGAGDHTITADYSGDAEFLPSSGSTVQVVTKADTAIAITAEPEPSGSGQQVTIRATVTPVPPAAGTPTGDVVFTISGIGNFTVALDASGQAVLTTSALTAGEYTITAAYTGDSDFNGISGSISHHVGQTATTTTVTSSPNPSVFGQEVTFTATVTPTVPGGTPTGEVAFSVDGSAPVLVPLVGGTATFTTSSLATGEHAVTAVYGGDVNFTGSTGTATQTVGQSLTRTTLASSPNPSQSGQAFTLTATVTPVAPGAGTPTGIVTFTLSSGGTVDVTLVNGVATTTDTLPAGQYTSTAAYHGDANFAPSTGSDSHQVVRAATTTTVGSAPEPSQFGETVTITVVVAPVLPGAGTPTGIVTLTIDSGTPVDLPLAGGTATLTTSALSVGSHDIVAVYGGDVNFTGSTGTHTQTVERALTSTAVTSAPDPSHFGETVALTATVTRSSPGTGTPTGTVTFTVDGPGGFTQTVPLGGDGTAVVTTSALGAGTHTVTADYSGDADFAPSSGTDTQTVDKTATTTTVTTSPNPTVPGDPVTLTAVVAPAPPGTGTPTGTVTFVVDGGGGGTFTGTLDANGVATVTVATLDTGTHNVTATYLGDADFAGSSGSTTHTVGTPTSATTVTTAPNPSVTGETVILTAVVTAVPPATGTPTGTVTFTVTGPSGTFTFSGTLDANGVATVATDVLGAGTYSVTAAYSGDGTFGPSSGSTTHLVAQAATVTTVTTTPNPSAFGEAVTVTATVAVTAPGTGTPTGNVVFTLSGTGGETVTVPLGPGGTATLTTSTLVAGAHTVTAAYSGDADFEASTGSAIQNVTQSATTTTVTSSPNPSTYGEQVTFDAVVASVAPGTGIPTGTVTFTSSAGWTRTVALDGTGHATFTTSVPLPAGSETVTAVYSGDANFTSSTGTLTQDVGLADTTTTVTSSPNPTRFGQPVTISATVAPVVPGVGVPTGTVTFSTSSGQSLTVPLDASGTATFTTSTPFPVGTETITATYSGDANFNPSTGSTTQAVNPADTTTTVGSSPDPSVFGQPVTLTATVTAAAPGAGVPTGTVTFTVTGPGGGSVTSTLDAGGVATATFTTLQPGTHPVSADYNGDADFTPSTGTGSQTVTAATTASTITVSPTPSAFGEPVTVTVVVAPVAPGAGVPTGDVTFTITGDGGGTFTATLDGSGRATLTIATLGTGSHDITATYPGDADFTGSTSTQTQTVNAAATTTTLVTSPNPTLSGESFTATATVAPVAPGAGTPTGTVTFALSGGTTVDAPLVGGVATITAALPAGVRLLSATYPGDAHFTGSTGTETHAVDKAATTTTVTPAPDPSQFGQAVAVAVAVAPVAPGAGTPTGFVTVTIDGSGSVDLPLAGGTATLTTSALSVGSHDITAVYGGDADFTGSTGTGTQTVQRALTSTTVASAPDPSHFGETVALTATVTRSSPGTGTPAGTVTFTVDGPGGFTQTAPLGSGGTAVVTTSALGAGTHTITADYSGDTDFAPSTGTDTQTVGTTATTTTVTSSPDPSGLGQPVTLTATVARATPGAGTPAGTVTFTVDGTGGGTFTGTLDANGVATVTVDTLGVGDHNVTAAYGGDADFSGSSGTTTHTVGTPTSATTVSASPDPSVFGETVTLTALVTAVPPAIGTPTGTVTFTVTGSGGGTVTAALVAGVATATISSLEAGTHSVTASYGGDGTFGPSSSSTTHLVTQSATTTAVTSSPSPSAFGQPVTVTATVAASAPGAGVPTGSVQFTFSGGQVVSVPLSDGIASFTTAGLTAGSHIVTAAYSGDPNFASSQASTSQTVTPAATTTTVTSAPNPSVYGAQVTISAVVAPVAPGAGIPTGTVTFTSSSGRTRTVALDASGVATFTTSVPFSAGDELITATYNGDGNFASSTGSTTQVINPADTTTTVTSAPNPSVFGEAVTVSARVAPVTPGAGIPTGTVTFTIGGAGGSVVTAPLDAGGTATVTTSTLAADPHTITAAYSGDANFTPSSGSGTQQVGQAATSTSVTASPSPSVFGQAVTFTATITASAPGSGVPTGTVSFVIDGGAPVDVTLDSSGQATLSVSTLPAGDHTVTATYSGAPDFAASTVSHTQTVGRATTSTAVATSPNPSVFGQAVTMTATVSANPPGAGTPTGTVAFTLSTGETATVPLSGGVATLTLNTLAPGGHTVTAVYSGDADFTTSTGTATQTVGQSATTTTLINTPNPSVSGQAFTGTAVVAPVAPGAGVPTGTVTFTLSTGTSIDVPLVGGVATASVALPAGVYFGTAVYHGDADFTGSTGTGTQTVDRADTATTLTSAP